jgi:hypothetical protein
MRIVLVIGAGGSLAQAIGFRPHRPHGQYPPLDDNFFAAVAELASINPQIRTAEVRFQRSLRASGAFADPWLPVTSSLEQFFADVYYEVARSRAGAPFEVFVSLLDLYVRTLEETTNWMGQRRRHGVIGQLLRNELSHAEGDRLTIITFNHDLVIEHEVARLPRIGDRWCLEGLYGDLPLVSLSNPGRAPAFPRHDEAVCSHECPIELLKLHGSLNWVVRTKSSDPELGTIFPSPRAKGRAIYLHHLTSAHHYGAAITPPRPGPGMRNWYAWPLVVPPVYDKHRMTGTELLGELWGTARDRILEADRLVLIGYSLPESDVFARQMLRRGFAGNEPLEIVECVNPDPSITGKLKGSLGASVVRQYNDIASYLRHGWS